MQRNSFNILYLVLTIQSKVIDQSLDRGPVLGVLWLLFNPATSIVEAPDRRHYNRARPVAESTNAPSGRASLCDRWRKIVDRFYIEKTLKNGKTHTVFYLIF